MKSVTFVLVCCFLAGCKITVPSDGQGAPATPQRPTFSSNTKTTAEGTLEIEGGLLIDWKDRIDTPFAAKYGATPTTEFFVGWSPYVNYDTMGIDGSSVGDTLIGVRQRMQSVADGEISSAFQLATKLPTSDEGEIGTTGEIDFFAAGIVDIDRPGLSLTGFGQLGFLGEVNDEDVDLQWLFSATGLLPGLLIDSAITAGAIAFILMTQRLSHATRTLCLAFMALATGYAVVNNVHALLSLGVSPLGIG